MNKLIEIAKSEKMIKHYKAFAWNAGAMLFAGLAELVTMVFTEWNPDSILTVTLGLVLARITKELNSK